MFDHQQHTTRLNLIIAAMGLCLAVAGVSGAAIVANPTGVAGTDVDPGGSQAVNKQVGNLTLADLNADAGQFTLAFDDAAYTTNQHLDKVTFDTTSEFGADLTVDIQGTNTNWWWVISNAGRGSSFPKTLSLRNLALSEADGRWAYITFSTPMQRVGFVLSHVMTGDVFTVSFYGDAAGNNFAGTDLLDSFTFSGDSAEDEVFVGYENLAGIERIQIEWPTVGSPSGPSDFRGFDDLSFVAIPEPGTMMLMAVGGVVALRRRS